MPPKSSPPEPATDRPPAKDSALGRLFRFRLRTLFVLVAFCAVLVGWWRDRSQLQEKLRRIELIQRTTLPDKDQRVVFEERLLRALEQAEERKAPFPEPPIESTTELVRERVAELVDANENPRIRNRAAIRLAEPGDAYEAAVADAVTALIGALDDDAVGKQAALSLGHLGCRARLAIEPLRARLQQPNALVAARCAWALYRIDRTLDLSPRIEQLLNDDDAEARWWAAYAVTSSDNVGAAPALVVLLRDPNAEVRRVAAYGVMNLAPREEALQALAEAAATETDAQVRASLAMELQLLQIGRARRSPAQVMAEISSRPPPPPEPARLPNIAPPPPSLSSPPGRWPGPPPAPPIGKTRMGPLFPAEPRLPERPAPLL